MSTLKGVTPAMIGMRIQGFFGTLLHGLALASMLWLAACGSGGNGGGKQSPPPPAPSTVTLSGFARFEFPPPNAGCRGLDFNAIQNRPIRGATVEIVDSTSNARITSTTTDDSGFYSVNVASNTGVFVRVRSELKRSGSPSWDVEVRNNTANRIVPLGQRPLYFLDSVPFNTGGADLTQNLLAGTGWSGSSYTGVRAAAPFSVLDIIYKMMQLVVTDGDPAANFPPLDAYWSPGNNTSLGSGDLLADIDSGDIGTTFYIGGSVGALVLLGRDGDDSEEFDDHVVAHEWGHYFEDRFSRSDSIGGQHSFLDILDMRLAFGEGFGYAISGIGLDDPTVCDTLWGAGGVMDGFGFSAESTTSGTPGWFNEFSLMRLIYDLWDSNNDGADTMSIGFGPIFDVLTGPQTTSPAFTSAFTFFAALKAQPNAATAFIDALLTQENITAAGITPFGDTETNNAGAAMDVLPVYTDIMLNNTAQICANSQFDFAVRFGNKLSEYRFLKLDLASPQALTFRMDTVNPPTQPSAGFVCGVDPADPENHTHSDPDFQVWRDGQLIVQGFGCGPNQEVANSGVLAAGTYVIELNEFRHSDALTNTPGGFPQRICFDVTVTP